MKRWISLLCGLSLLFSTQVHAGLDLYPFSNEVDERRFQSLTRELRCPKCQNQNIADSDAPLAKDLRDYTYSMILDGRADSEIIGFMVDRYGDFVTYNPPVKPVTWLLWFGPGGMLALILGYIFFFRKPKKTPEVEPTRSLSADDRARLEKILQSKE